MRLLLIEDDEQMALTLAKDLRETYAVDVAFTGKEGIYQIRVNTYDLVILDISLPDANGIEMCREIRKLGINMPILILTANDETEQKVAALDSGADDYLTKPFNLDEFSARVRALLRRPSEALLDTILSVDDLTLDPVRRLVTRGKKVINLRRKQFDILEYLLRNKEQAVSRTRILEHVWDFSTDPYSNIVDVHVKYLRDQIDRPFKYPLVHTIAGIGYKIQGKEVVKHE